MKIEITSVVFEKKAHQYQLFSTKSRNSSYLLNDSHKLFLLQKKSELYLWWDTVVREWVFLQLMRVEGKCFFLRLPVFVALLIDKEKHKAETCPYFSLHWIDSEGEILGFISWPDEIIFGSIFHPFAFSGGKRTSNHYSCAHLNPEVWQRCTHRSKLNHSMVQSQRWIQTFFSQREFFRTKGALAVWTGLGLAWTRLPGQFSFRTLGLGPCLSLFFHEDSGLTWFYRDEQVLDTILPRGLQRPLFSGPVSTQRVWKSLARTGLARDKISKY